MSRERFHDLEEAMRRGRASSAAAGACDRGTGASGESCRQVRRGGTDGRRARRTARAGFSSSCRAATDSRTDWPLMFAMHGGPAGSAAQARSGADRMLRVWADAAEEAGWIVAAPALTPSVVAGTRTEQRLPHELFHPEQARAVIDALRARYRINPIAWSRPASRSDRTIQSPSRPRIPTGSPRSCRSRPKGTRASCCCAICGTSRSTSSRDRRTRTSGRSPVRARCATS